jgi:hypothetical protein
MFLTFLLPRTEKAPLRMRSGDGTKVGRRVEGPMLKPTAPQPQWRRFAEQGTLEPSRLELRNEMPGAFCYPDSRMGWPAPPVSGSVCATQPETFFRDQLFPTPLLFLWSIVRLSWRAFIAER